jgi:hypothetical protein
MLAAVVAVVNEQRDLSELVGKVNRNLPAGTEPLEIPLRTARYTPAPTPPRLGNVLKSRLKYPGGNRVARGGPEAYETYEDEAERPPFGGEQAFDPEPLFRTVVIPSFRKGSTFFRPD